ncbi:MULTISPECIES: hypothetical protein [Pseudomonas]|uniref:YobI family P-loop NTPase n=1 Tax=Pseudomonas TaxID=286 RepID=UPI001184B04B|nr:MULTISPECIES: hypothetical protein [Pseudomonas]MBC8978661.1 hypothetical protein [Pseudomonas lurida]MCF5026926.1 hypothetical protein [Pseudomonas lurida]MCF5308917.1 hypothetical protein [Pseudomonas lurida]MCF5327393.1 hypothetical protein [Pseudomonas lurida]WSO02967.1 hypothetical protein VUJ48_14260 [Pseudomonas lurida]
MNEEGFVDLTPVLLNGSHADRYVSELLHALENEQVRNIAITGGYGAGKSSVIRTFFNRHPEYEPVFISLATFSQDSPAERAISPAESQAKNDDLMPRIEETIVQQLLYAVPARKVPKTRLKRIVHASNARNVFYTVFFALLIASGVRLYLPFVDPMPKYVPDWLITQLLWVPDSCTLAFILAAGVYLLYCALKYLSLFSIDGLTLKGGKLESIHHGSVLHKHVDEIIYCFERSDINVVVIEDLDRFGIQDVFFRLREINFTIKQSPQVARPVHFIYAIRDELFFADDQAKFFDLIIPVVPVVNSENSQEKMTDLLKAKRFDSIRRFDPELIETVCYYIDDMRLIKNIVNELDLFSSLLGGRGVRLDANKLLAMVVVRNLYPEACAELTKRRGPIFSVFNEFGDWRIAQAKEIEAQVSYLREQLAIMEREHVASLEELRVCVWYQVVKLINPVDTTDLTYDNEVTVTLTEFVQDKFFDEIFKTDRTLSMESRHHISFGAQVKTVESEGVLQLMSYRERASRLTAEREVFAREIEALNDQSIRIQRMSFREAAKAEYGEVLAQKLKGTKALIYLMREGYLDTDYYDYQGFFYEGSLTQDDKNLILALRGGESPDVMTVVNNPERVLGKLDQKALGEGRGLIAGLVDYLCSQYTAADHGPHWWKLSAILSTAAQFMPRFASVVDYILTSENAPTLIQAIYDIDPESLEGLFSSKRFVDSGPRQALLCVMVSSLSHGQISALEDCDHGVLEILEGLQDVSHVVSLLAEGEATWGWLRQHPVQLYNLSDTVAANDLKQLVSWGFIAPELKMLLLICASFESDSQQQSPVTYRRLTALGLEGIDRLLQRDPQRLAQQLLSQTGLLDESAESLAALLAAIGAESEWVNPLLDRTNCQFTTLASAPEKLWERLLAANRVSDKAEAVWSYFRANAGSLMPRFHTKAEHRNRKKSADFNSFIVLNVEVLGDFLWQLHPDEHHKLQLYLLKQPLISNEMLVPLLSMATLKSTEMLNTIPSERWGMLVASDFLPQSEMMREFVHRHASPEHAAYFERRDPLFNATNSPSTPHMNTAGDLEA